MLIVRIPVCPYIDRKSIKENSDTWSGALLFIPENSVPGPVSSGFVRGFARTCSTISDCVADCTTASAEPCQVFQVRSVAKDPNPGASTIGCVARN